MLAVNLLFWTFELFRIKIARTANNSILSLQTHSHFSVIEKRTEDSFIKSRGQLKIWKTTLVISMSVVSEESLGKGDVSSIPTERDVAILSSMFCFHFRIDAEYLWELFTKRNGFKSTHLALLNSHWWPRFHHFCGLSCLSPTAC